MASTSPCCQLLLVYGLPPPKMYWFASWFQLKINLAGPNPSAPLTGFPGTEAAMHALGPQVLVLRSPALLWHHPPLGIAGPWVSRSLGSPRLVGVVGFLLASSPSTALLHFFLREIRFPTKIDYRKEGTLILTCLVEDLVGVHLRTKGAHRVLVDPQGYALSGPFENLWLQSLCPAASGCTN